MTISLPYRQDIIEVEIAEEKIISVLEPNDVRICFDPVTAVGEAAGSSFSEFLRQPGKLLVIVNDGTRPTPTRIVLEAIAEDLHEARAEFIIATGAHRAPTRDEYRFIFGSAWEMFRERVSVHDAINDDMYRLGLTSGGTEVFLNTKVRDAQRVLIIGSVEPHYFAGYTGGRKGFLPGVAALGTIEQNHRFALSPESRTLSLAGNPVHEDMIEACAMIDKNVFTIMTVLDRRQEIYAVTSGGLNSAFDEAVKLSEEVFLVPLESKADLVIACAKYPMDIDLYQSQKAIENAKPALKDGGTLVLVSSCRDGIGDDTFSRLLSSCETPDAVFRKIEDGYKLGYHKAAKIAELCGKARVMAFTELDDSVLENIFIEPVGNLQDTIDKLLLNPEVKVVIMPDASVTVPLVTAGC